MTRSLSCFIILSVYLNFFNQAFARVKAEEQLLEAETAQLIGGASKVADQSTSGGLQVNLAKPGQELNFENLPEASKLATCYASKNVGFYFGTIPQALGTL